MCTAFAARFPVTANYDALGLGTGGAKASSDDKPTATWSDVETKLGDFDRPALLGLVQDLYTASKYNRNFLSAADA